MRVKVTNAKATVIARGPGTFLIRNKTASTSVFLETGAVLPGAEPAPLATEANGAEWEKTGGTLEVRLGPEQVLTGIVKAGEGEQELHILRNGPHF
jgi:hypothetical protein